MMNHTIVHNRKFFKRYAAFLVIYCIITILWGAFVRISGSGDGCGVHWPLCHGELIPGSTVVKTWIEYFHRIKSGLFLILILIQLVWGYMLFPRKHTVRKLTCAVAIVTALEAHLGALLVLGKYVATDASIMRLVIMSLHLINTLILLGLLTLTWHTSGNGTLKRSVGGLDLFSLTLFLFIAVTGGWAALSTTLFPAASLHGGLVEDFSSVSHLFVRLRIVHPIAALALGVGLFLMQLKVRESIAASKDRYLKLFLSIFAIHLLVGIATLLLLSPATLKIVHLFTADLSWCSLILLVYAEKTTVFDGENKEVTA